MPCAIVASAYIRLGNQGRPNKVGKKLLNFSVLDSAHLYFPPFHQASSIPVCSSSNIPCYFISLCLYTCYYLLCLQIPPTPLSLPPFFCSTSNNTPLFIPQTLDKMLGSLKRGLSSVL